MNADGMDDGETAIKTLMGRFRSNEARNVVGFVAQIACLKLREDEEVQSFSSITAQKVYFRIQHAGGTLTPAIFTAAFLNGLREQYEHFIVREFWTVLSQH